eukprot:s12161_g1.t1
MGTLRKLPEWLSAATGNQSNEALLRKAMTTKFPSTQILMELAEELSAKNCELQLQWVRRRVDPQGEALEWRVLGRLGRLLSRALKLFMVAELWPKAGDSIAPGPSRRVKELPVPVQDKDLLGRWKPEGSDTYARTFAGRVARLQALRWPDGQIATIGWMSGRLRQTWFHG